VDHEHGEPDWQRRQNLITISLIRTQATHPHEGALAITVTHNRELDPFPYRNVGVVSVALGVSSREDGVHEDEGANDLCGEREPCQWRTRRQPCWRRRRIARRIRYGIP
jgi:hypothetical protein